MIECRQTGKKIYFWAMGLLVLLFGACGGGGSSGPPSLTLPPPPALPPPPPPFLAGGIWEGTIEAPPQVPMRSISAIIDENGMARMGTGTQYVFSVFDASFDTNISVYAPPGRIFLSGNTVESGTATGLLVERQSLEMNFDIPGYATGTASLIYNADLYERTATPTKASGMWGLGSTVFNVEVNGAVTGQDSSGCTYNGTISVVNAQHNAYRLSINVGMCAGLSGPYSGTAYIEDRSLAASGEVIEGSLYLFMTSNQNSMYRVLGKL